MFENDGSNALKQEYAFEIPELEPERRPERPQRAKRAKKRHLTAQKKVAIFAVTMALFAMASTVLVFKAELNTQYKNLSEEKAILSSLTAQAEQLSSEIESSGSIVAIDEKATELGLRQASQSQIVYISLGSEDGGQILAEDKSTGGLSLFLNKVAAIAEYLY